MYRAKNLPQVKTIIDSFEDTELQAQELMKFHVDIQGYIRSRLEKNDLKDILCTSFEVWFVDGMEYTFQFLENNV